MKKIKFLNALSGFRNLIILLIVVVGVFSIYNIFLVDHALENLKLSLEKTALAYGISDLDGLDIIINEALMKEILPHTLDSVSVVNLEYATSIAERGKSYQQIDHMKVALGTAIKRMEKKRGKFLTILDKINRVLKKITANLVRLPRRLLQLYKPKGTFKVEMDLFQKARSEELDGNFREAVGYYDAFIKRFPDYEKIALVKLRLAYVYHKLGDYEKADLLYREITREHFDEKESDIARALLFKLKQREDLRNKVNQLLMKTVEIPDQEKQKKQNMYYQLGVISSLLLDMEEAIKFFKRSIDIDTKSDLASKSRFNIAWLSKQEHNLDVSLMELQNMAEENPDNLLAADINYQLADIYHKQGRYEDAIDLYKKLADEYEGDEVASLSLFQAGASYMYDLNKDEEAEKIFTQLKKEHAESVYSKYLEPDNPIGIFITYLVPRATRVVAWRVAGLLCLTGFSGKLARFEAIVTEAGFNIALNDWLRAELPDTVGNLYVDIKGAELDMEKNTTHGEGKITMGRFSIKGEADGHLKLENDGRASVIIDSAYVEKVPIPPTLLNSALSGISLMTRKHIPIIMTRLSMNKDEIIAEGYGSKRTLELVKEVAGGLLGLDINIKDLDSSEIEEFYSKFSNEFPESNFTPFPKYDTENLFLDFFTRIHLYIGFKLLETVKDTKLDYERSVRSLGKLLIKHNKFQISYKEADINTSLNKYIRDEFPWILDNRYLFDVRGLELHFMDSGEIEFESYISIGIVMKVDYEQFETMNIRVNAIATLDIDEESKIPLLVFKKVYLNGKPFPAERLNLVSKRYLNLLKDGRIPFRLEKAIIYDGGIILKGEGAKDFLARIFSDPHPFVIFQIRHWDLRAAGITRLKEWPGSHQAIGDYWRGRAFGFEKEVGKTAGGQAGRSHKRYKTSP